MGVNYYTSANRVVEFPLTTVYTKAIAANVIGQAVCWRHVRIRQKRFDYVGMCADTAAQCAAAMADKYNRWFMNWQLDPSTGGYKPVATIWPVASPTTLTQLNGRYQAQCANIVMARTGPDLYKVSVDLNETVYAYTQVSSSTPAALFSLYYGDWDYDE